MMDYLDQLEERITLLIRHYSSMKEENAVLSRANAEAKDRLEELERENRGLKENREQARERMEVLIKKIEEMGDK